MTDCDMMPLFGVGSRGGALKAPPTPPQGNLRVVWRRLVLKAPPKCTGCQIRLASEWGTGVPYIPASVAEWERKDAEGVLYFCNVHGMDTQHEEQKAAAAVLRDSVKPAVKRTPRRRKPAQRAVV